MYVRSPAQLKHDGQHEETPENQAKEREIMVHRGTTAQEKTAR